MGQQQLLLLVLSTVIVGLATVAGIQAFSENQQQATQDALVQRAISLGNEVKAAHDTPSQLGGIDLGSESTDSKIADAIGVSSLTVPAEGAGESAQCKINDSQTDTIVCGSNGTDTNGAKGDVQVTVNVDPDAENPVSVNSITVAS